MSHERRLPLAAAVTTLALAACAPDGPVEPAATPPAAALTAAAHAGHSAGSPAYGAEVQRWVAGVRATTAAYHDFDLARADEHYPAQITGCMEQPGVGGMGYHYGKPSLIDGTVEEFAPELLLFEPQKNGRMRLVAVEYIVPFTLWEGEEPPVLHGLEFQRNEVFQVWALHVWTFADNPSGLFAGYNPTITCNYAS